MTGQDAPGSPSGSGTEAVDNPDTAPGPPAATETDDHLDPDPAPAEPAPASDEAPAEPSPDLREDPEAGRDEAVASTADAAEPVSDLELDATRAHPGVAEEKPGEERWAAFAPTPEDEARLARQVTPQTGGRIGRFLTHEWTLAALGSVLLSLVMTWPTMRNPTSTLPEDLGDPTLQAWELSWAGHTILHHPGQLWTGNVFYPLKDSFAFSDTLLGYLPFSLIGTGQTAALVRYNIIFVLIFALAFFGAYALVRQLGAGRTGAAVAGAAFAYAPWRLGQSGHLHVLSTGGIALALAMLARGHGFSLTGGFRPERARWGWVLGGWVVAAWQLTIGFGMGLPFVYVMVGLVLVSAVQFVVRRIWVWKEPRPFRRSLVFADLGGGIIFAAVGGLMAWPYMQVLKLYPESSRGVEQLALFSPPLRGFFIPPPESLLWGDLYKNARGALYWAPEMAVLPGFFLYALAVAGLFVSVWQLRQRIYLALAAAVSMVLAMGTSGPAQGKGGYLVLYHLLPGFQGLRTPGRLVMWTTLFLGLLAAGAVAGFVNRAIAVRTAKGDHERQQRTGFLPRLASLIPLVLVLAEGLNTIQHPGVPPEPMAMSSIQGPAVVLPDADFNDELIMLWTVDGFPKVTNGVSGFVPNEQATIVQTMSTFPDQASVQLLKSLHIRTVLVVRSAAVGTPNTIAIDAPIDGLGLTRTESGDVVIYTVN